MTANPQTFLEIMRARYGDGFGRIEKRKDHIEPSYTETVIIKRNGGDSRTILQKKPVDRMAIEVARPTIYSLGGGPGAELKKILGIIGIKSTKNCQCDSRALIMDREGPEWCRQNMNTILGWLEEEAKKRGLPFVRTVAKAMVNLAIRRAEKKTSRW